MKYVLTLTHGDEEFQSEGETIEEALETLTLPEKIVTKGFVRLTHGKRETERMFFPRELKRFFYPVSRKFVANALETTLKEPVSHESN